MVVVVAVVVVDGLLYNKPRSSAISLANSNPSIWPNFDISPIFHKHGFP